MSLVASGIWLKSVMTRRIPQVNSTGICLSEGRRISISTKVATATRHGSGMNNMDIPRSYGWRVGVRQSSDGVASPPLTLKAGVKLLRRLFL